MWRLSEETASSESVTIVVKHAFGPSSSRSRNHTTSTTKRLWAYLIGIEAERAGIVNYRKMGLQKNRIIGVLRRECRCGFFDPEKAQAYDGKPFSFASLSPSKRLAFHGKSVNFCLHRRKDA